ncbi:hypothetical protein CEXT_120311 [Caerostris extrusa]|uniref:Uncharacterized protein n=1 Tax=Caerostris extrusa TaxID=172846 RepID=A0AAV4MTB4_CAEEX|nr:hypothetical protein CEXT_120311 [Caerostris extrusa]
MKVTSIYAMGDPGVAKSQLYPSLIVWQQDCWICQKHLLTKQQFGRRVQIATDQIFRDMISELNSRTIKRADAQERCLPRIQP